MAGDGGVGGMEDRPGALIALVRRKRSWIAGLPAPIVILPLALQLPDTESERLGEDLPSRSVTL